MAISRDKKRSLVHEVSELFASAKTIVGAAYAGLSVADLQELRRLAREKGLRVKVVKNRLIKVALADLDQFKNTNVSQLKGQLVYVFSDEDEAAPAQVLANFAKTHPSLRLVTGFDEAGRLLDPNTLDALATLPGKDQLRARMAGTIAAPLSGLVSVLNGNQRGLVQVLSARSEHM